MTLATDSTMLSGKLAVANIDYADLCTVWFNNWPKNFDERPHRRGGFFTGTM